MQIQALITQAQEKAGRAVQAARDLGQQIRQKEEAGESAAELYEQFTTASADAQSLIATVNRLKAELELERQAEELRKPVQVHIRATEQPVEAFVDPAVGRAERKHRRRMLAQIELFRRAGVENFDKFLKFRDAHMESFVPFVLNGPTAAMDVFENAGFRRQESFALVSTSGDLGGFLVPDDFRAEVLRDLAGFAVMRPICRVLTTGGPALVFPTIASATSNANIYSSGYAGAWRAEGYVTGGTTPTVQNQPTFGQSRVPVNVWAPNAVEITNELLSDSAADLESILAEVIAETLALDEDAGFINGSGVSQPLGILNSLSGTSLTEVNSGHATQITYDGLVDLFSSLPSQYRQNARWMMNSLTFGAILKLKDGQNQPLFPVNQTPGQLWGKPVSFSEFVPDIGANTNPIVFGDFRYYGIADRQELRIQRLVERYAPNIGILPTARVGGQPLRTAAFRKQKISA